MLEYVGILEFYRIFKDQIISGQRTPNTINQLRVGVVSKKARKFRIAEIETNY